MGNVMRKWGKSTGHDCKHLVSEVIFLWYLIHKGLKKKNFCFAWDNLTISWWGLGENFPMVKIRITQSLALLKTFFGSMWLIFKLVPPAMPWSFPAGLPGTHTAPSLMSKASSPKRHFLLGRKIWPLSWHMPLCRSVHLSNRSLPISASKGLSQTSAMGEVFVGYSCSAP